MTLAKAVGISTGIASLIGALLAVYSHFAKAEEHEQLKAYTQYTFEELRLERLEDKIIELEIKPEPQREVWEKEKLERLKAQKQRAIRKLEQSENHVFELWR